MLMASLFCITVNVCMWTPPLQRCNKCGNIFLSVKIAHLLVS
jgi:hypothetical protein